MLNVQRQVQRNRPLVTLIVLVLLCLISLGTGTQSTIIHRGVKRVIEFTTYPVLKVQHWASGSLSAAYTYVVAAGQMRRENSQLHEEVIKLREALASGREVESQNRRLREDLNFVRDATRFEVVPAAVLVSFIQGHEPGVLLTKRTAHLNKHAGQVSFPGGRIDPGDASPEAAALVQPPAEQAAMAPGTVLQVVPNVGLVVATGGCPLLLRGAQLEGKGAAHGGPLLQQLQASAGDRLG